MIFSQLPKPNFTAILISSFIALQITTAEAAITTDPATNQVAMYSYNANLSDAQPLSGAALEQTTVYMFFNDTPQYSSMDFYCCKGIDGASTGEAHKTPVFDSSAPFVYSVDLSQYSTAGTRELYVDRIRTDGSGIDNIYVNFSINTSIIPIIPNTPAVISGIDSASLTEDLDNNGTLVANGKLNITDSDAGEAALIAKTVNGNYGIFYIVTTGHWYYVADNNQPVIQNLVSGATLTDSLIVNSVDGTPHTIVITINGVNEANNPALITGLDRASLTEDVDPNADNLLEVSGLLNITDSDAGEAAFIAKVVNGNYGKLLIATTGQWFYGADNNQAAIQNLASGATLTDRLIVNSVDGTAHTVAITILGVDENNTPADIILSWVAPAEREDNSALSLSAIAGYNVYYGTTQGQYSDNVTINDGTATGYTFTSLPAGTYYFVVTTIDTEGRESQYSSVVTIII